MISYIITLVIFGATLRLLPDVIDWIFNYKERYVFRDAILIVLSICIYSVAIEML